MRGAAESTSCPGNLGPVRCPGRPRPGFQCLPRRPDFPGHSDRGSCPWSRGLDQLPRGGSGRVQASVAWSRCPWPLGPMPEVPWDAPALPGHSGPCPMSRGLDQLSQATRACACGPPVLTSCPGGLGPGSEGPQARPAVLGDMGQCPRVCGVGNLSQAARDRVRGTAVSTSCPRWLEPGS